MTNQAKTTKTTKLHGIDISEYVIDCPCDECAGGCDEMNPTCGECFLCEAKADDDKWWEGNRSDVLQI